jgi:uncharacterized protein
MSSGPNPPLENIPPSPELPGITPLAPPPPEPIENPVWSGWDVLLIVLITILMVMLISPAIAVVLAHTFLYHNVPLLNVAQKPWLGLTSEFAGYLLVFIFMMMFIEGRYQTPFFRALRWNWPSRTWITFAGIGIAVFIVVLGLEQFLPMPKDVLMDKFFENTRDAYLTSIFAITFGPFMEELIFRGFLYPVLARRIGMVASITITGILFGLVHSLQLSYAWGPVLLIVIVGIVLTTVRALKKSVGASLIVHITYNFMLTGAAFIGSDGFRHLDKLTR